MSQPQRIITVSWRKNDDDPGTVRQADFTDDRDAAWFADRLTGHGAVDPDSITIEAKINKTYH